MSLQFSSLHSFSLGILVSTTSPSCFFLLSFIRMVALGFWVSALTMDVVGIELGNESCYVAPLFGIGGTMLSVLGSRSSTT